MSGFGPQISIPIGAAETPGSNIGAWQGLTIKEILEKVDLSNIIMDDDSKQKEAKNVNDPTLTMTGAINPESAFLGPRLWSRSIPMPIASDTEDFSVMNIDDFLSENGFDLNDPESPSTDNDNEPIGSPSSDMDTDGMTYEQEKPMVTITKKGSKRPASEFKGKDGAANTFLYVESKRARMEREKEERRKKSASEIEFTPEELALATVPGMNFDPKQRRFAPDELRPQPIIRKRKKSFVPQDSKDDKYWEKREKNNIAARRSREARRLKENQIALRTAFLEKENAGLKRELEQAKAENMELVSEKQLLLEKLKRYE